MTNINIDNTLHQSSHDKKSFQMTFLFIIYSFVTIIKSLISYPGGKYKMKKDLNEVFWKLTPTKKYETYIDGFFGMGGSLMSMSDSLLEHGVTKVIVNDINPCIIKTHQCVRNHSDEMISYFSEIVRKEIVIPHGQFFITAEELLRVKKRLVQRFDELQNKKEYGIESSTLFIMLSSFNFSGVVNIKKGGIIKFSDSIYEYGDIKDFFFMTIKRIQTYSELYNKFDMSFYNVDYFDLHRHFKGRKNTLWNIDTVYVKEDYTEYIKEDMERLQNSQILGCKCDYSQSDFDHIGVLESLKDIDFIYNNNTHPIMYHYVDKFNLKHRLFERKEIISGNKDTETKNVTEIILYGNNFKSVSNNINFENLTQKSA